MGAINVYIGGQDEGHAEPEREEPFDESLKDPIDSIGEDHGPDIVPTGPVPEGEYEDPLSESCGGLMEKEIERRGTVETLMKLLGR
jgi:hypothetical protein